VGGWDVGGVAVAVVDLGAVPAARLALAGDGAVATVFEVGSVTKALTARFALLGRDPYRRISADEVLLVAARQALRARPLVWHNGQTGGYASFLGLHPRAGRAVFVPSSVAREPEAHHIAQQLTSAFADGHDRA